VTDLLAVPVNVDRPADVPLSLTPCFTGIGRGSEQNRKNGSLTCYAPDGKPVAKYTFKKGWPCKWKGPSFDSSKNEIAIEELEIAHEGLERQQ